MRNPNGFLNDGQAGLGLCGIEFMKTTLRDSGGKILGYIQEVFPYRHELHNAGGKTLGFYNPHTDRTFTASGRLVGKGNLLASLLR